MGKHHSLVLMVHCDIIRMLARTLATIHQHWQANRPLQICLNLIEMSTTY